MMNPYSDPDPQETQEWIESIEDALEEHGYERTRHLLETLIDYAQSKGARLPFNTVTPFINTILPSQQPAYPGDREIEGGTADRDQVWMAPSYSKIDLHAYYNLPMQVAGTNIQLFAHVFNLTDALFIQDATDNSQYNSFDKDHDADSAEIFFGTPRYVNMGLSVRF